MSIHEKKFISLIGDLYEMRGQIRTQGMIWGLIYLKKSSPLDQQQMAFLLEISVSTVSRNVKILQKLHLIEFREENDLNDTDTLHFERKYYSRRKYFIKTDIKDLIKFSIQAIINNSMKFRKELFDLQNTLIKDGGKNSNINNNLIDNITEINNRITILNKIFTQFAKESEEVFKDV